MVFLGVILVLCSILGIFLVHQFTHRFFIKVSHQNLAKSVVQLKKNMPITPLEFKLSQDLLNQARLNDDLVDWLAIVLNSFFVVMFLSPTVVVLHGGLLMYQQYRFLKKHRIVE